MIMTIMIMMTIKKQHSRKPNNSTLALSVCAQGMSSVIDYSYQVSIVLTVMQFTY